MQPLVLTLLVLSPGQFPSDGVGEQSWWGHSVPRAHTVATVDSQPDGGGAVDVDQSWLSPQTGLFVPSEPMWDESASRRDDTPWMGGATEAEEVIRWPASPDLIEPMAEDTTLGLAPPCESPCASQCASPCGVPGSEWVCTAADGCNGRRVGGHVAAGIWLGGLSGHLQTPNGGRPGSTSSHRPTVDEIGLHRVDWMPWLDAEASYGNAHALHFNYVWIDRSGQDVLSTALISQAQTFPAGSSVNSRVGLDTFRFGYRPLVWNLGQRSCSFTPEIGIGVSRLIYQLDSADATGPVDRRYNVGFPYIGFLLVTAPTDRLQFETELAGAGGINGVSFVDSEFRLAYGLRTAGPVRTDVILGWRGMWFRRHDSQEGEQNDPNLRFGWLASEPWSGLTMAVRLGF